MNPLPSEDFSGAACVGSDVDFFSYEPSEIKKAKEICDSCPVKRLCLEKALDEEHLFGVWGGVSQDELRRTRSVDINNQRTDNGSGNPIRCPWCGPHSTKHLEVQQRKRTGTEIICTNCKLEWHSKKAINKKKRNF